MNISSKTFDQSGANHHSYLRHHGDADHHNDDPNFHDHNVSNLGSIAVGTFFVRLNVFFVLFCSVGNSGVVVFNNPGCSGYMNVNNGY